MHHKHYMNLHLTCQAPYEMMLLKGITYKIADRSHGLIHVHTSQLILILVCWNISAIPLLTSS